MLPITAPIAAHTSSYHTVVNSTILNRCAIPTHVSGCRQRARWHIHTYKSINRSLYDPADGYGDVCPMASTSHNYITYYINANPFTQHFSSPLWQRTIQVSRGSEVMWAKRGEMCTSNIVKYEWKNLKYAKKIRIPKIVFCCYRLALNEM